jgi:enoyl-CoA hydratase/carnithine racemase
MIRKLRPFCLKNIKVEYLNQIIAREMSSSENILVNGPENPVVDIVLNRPKALNALTPDICLTLNKYIDSWNTNPASAPAALLMRGAGGKAFCAGGDVKAMWEDASAGGDTLGTGIKGRASADFFHDEYIMNYNLGVSSIPQVSMWDGVVMGGGVGISIFGEYRVATEKTMFAMPETAIGLFPDVGSSSWLPHLSGGVGEYISLTGIRLKAFDLIMLGIATHYIPSSAVDNFTERMLQEVKKESVSVTRETIDRLLAESGDGELPDAATSVFGSDPYHGMARVAACFEGKPTVEAVVAALEALKIAGGDQDKEWAEKTLASLNKCSPTSLKITLAQIQRGRSLNLKECLEMEFRIAQGCMRGTDFKEGVRAMLVDKDHTPVWNPATIDEISLDSVESHFAPLSERELKLPDSDKGLMGGERRVLSITSKDSFP